jgi:hypothetical protein
MSEYDGLYEITNVETGKTLILQDSEAKEHFGEGEWIEVLGGYLPHLVAVQIG